VESPNWKLPGMATTSDVERRWFLLAARSTQSSRRWSPCVGPGLLQLDVDADDGEALQQRLLCFVVVIDAAAST